MKRLRRVLLLIALLLSASFGAVAASGRSQAAAPSQLPDGPGKDKFQRTCSGCHLISIVTVQRKSADDWAGIVDDMHARGANGTDEDFDQIIAYLAANFGPATAARVNINTAASDAISTGLGVSRADADAIIAWRTGKGPFKDVESLKQVPGIDAAKVDAAKSRIDF